MKNECIKTIFERSSYRGKYSSKPVAREDLKLIMEAGLAAPSGCNMQTTSLIAVDDQELLAKVKAIITPPIFATAPAVICVLTRKIIAYRDRCFNVHDYSAAIENMLLAIKSLGYESCWYEGHVTDVDHFGNKIAKMLGVPDEYELVCILPIGEACDTLARKQKLPFEQRASFNAFNM